jgi:hypothetical protein
MEKRDDVMPRRPPSGAGAPSRDSGGMLPLMLRRLSMRAMTGSRRTGLLSTLAVFLLPALGVGIAGAQGPSVGDIVPLQIPDVSEFPAAVQTRDFLCVAVTEHAYWLVQDSTYLGSNPDSPDTSAVWGNYVDQDQIDSLSAQFEGDGVDVYGTVTSVFGPVPDTDSDPRVWIVIADIPDFFQNQSGPPTRVGRVAWVQASDIDGSGTFNNHDIFYISVGAFKTNQAVASQLRCWHVPSGLAMLIRTGVRPDDDLWLVRGLGQVAQYEVYGLTYVAVGPNKMGVQGNMTRFETAAGMELSQWNSGGQGIKANDYGANCGQEFLWFMYLQQRVGTQVLGDIVAADTTGMYAVARAIDPTVPDSTSLVDVVAPIYDDWLVTNVVNNLRSDFAGGIYKYDFLEGSAYQFTHSAATASFVNSFGSYPFPNWIADTAYGMAAPIWAAQYVRFLGDYSAAPSVFFNGMYSDGGGSGTAINGAWTVQVVQTDGSDVTDVVPVALNEYFNGTFDLAGGGTDYLVVTNNNPNGTPELRFVLSQDATTPLVMISMFQNLANPQYVDVYTSLYDGDTVVPEGFDWYGPIFEPSHLTGGTADSTSNLKMSAFGDSLTIWSERFSAWEAGTYDMSIAGFDSAGRSVGDVRQLAVGYSEGSGMALEVTSARLDLPAGSAAPGQMVMLAETDLLGLSLASAQPISACEPAMEGIVAGPVNISDVSGTLSFPASTQRGAVYRFNGTGWDRLDSYWQDGRMFAAVSGGGIYAYGTATGVTSPSLPAVLTMAGNSPNPFGSETVISFSLPSAGRTTVRVYDVTGRVVRTLADGDMTAASHSLVWDGRDESGNTVGAGIYFCRLEASGQSAVQKMIRVAE